MSVSQIFSVNGPVVTVKNATEFSMLEMVHVGNQELMGEVISINRGLTTIQVYESTTGLKPGEPVFSSGQPISVVLGPGILRNIFDGIERPLKAIAEIQGSFITTGSNVSPLDLERKWDVTLVVKIKDQVQFGDVYATIPETDLIEHRLMIPQDVKGEVIEVKKNGKYQIEDCIAKVKDEFGTIHSLTLSQKMAY